MKRSQIEWVLERHGLSVSKQLQVCLSERDRAHIKRLHVMSTLWSADTARAVDERVRNHLQDVSHQLNVIVSYTLDNTCDAYLTFNKYVVKLVQAYITSKTTTNCPSVVDAVLILQGGILFVTPTMTESQLDSAITTPLKMQTWCSVCEIEGYLPTYQEGKPLIHCDNCTATYHLTCCPSTCLRCGAENNIPVYKSSHGCTVINKSKSSNLTSFVRACSRNGVTLEVDDTIVCDMWARRCGWCDLRGATLDDGDTNFCDTSCLEAMKTYLSLLRENCTSTTTPATVDDWEPFECAICLSDVCTPLDYCCPCPHKHRFHQSCWDLHKKSCKNMCKRVFCVYCMTRLT